MSHPIYRVKSLKLLGGFRIRVGFDDGAQREIDLEPVLTGELFGPLRDRAFFEQVRIDPEIHTLVWPNGADFDPATLHDWQPPVAFGLGWKGLNHEEIKAEAQKSSFEEELEAETGGSGTCSSE